MSCYARLIHFANNYYNVKLTLENISLWSFTHIFNELTANLVYPSFELLDTSFKHLK